MTTIVTTIANYHSKTIADYLMTTMTITVIITTDPHRNYYD